MSGNIEEIERNATIQAGSSVQSLDPTAVCPHVAASPVRQIGTPSIVTPGEPAAIEAEQWIGTVGHGGWDTIPSPITLTGLPSIVTGGLACAAA